MYLASVWIALERDTGKTAVEDFDLRTPKKISVAALCREWLSRKEERRDDKCRRGVMTPQIGRYRLRESSYENKQLPGEGAA